MYDDSLGEIADGTGAGALGTVEVKLKALADGNTVEGPFKIKYSRRGRTHADETDLGTLELAVTWRNDLLESRYASSTALEPATTKHQDNNNNNNNNNNSRHGHKAKSATATSNLCSHDDRSDILSTFGLPRSHNATQVDWNMFVNYVLRSRNLAEAQVEWRLLAMEAVDGDIAAAEGSGLAGQRLQEALEIEDRDGDGFVTVDEVCVLLKLMFL